MKTILLLFALSTSCFALTNTPPGMLPPLPPPPPPKPAPVKPVSAEVRNFNANEFGVDLYGILSRPDLTGAPRWGEGIGVSYHITRGLGFGVRANAYGAGGAAFDEGEARILLRAPLWDRVAPYGYLAGVYSFDLDQWGAGAGGGLEFRLNKTIAIFGETGLRVTTEGKNDWISCVGVGARF